MDPTLGLNLGAVRGLATKTVRNGYEGSMRGMRARTRDRTLAEREMLEELRN